MAPRRPRRLLGQACALEGDWPPRIKQAVSLILRPGHARAARACAEPPRGGRSAWAASSRAPRLARASPARARVPARDVGCRVRRGAWAVSAASGIPTFQDVTGLDTSDRRAVLRRDRGRGREACFVLRFAFFVVPQTRVGLVCWGLVECRRGLTVFFVPSLRNYCDPPAPPRPPFLLSGPAAMPDEWPEEEFTQARPQAVRGDVRVIRTASLHPPSRPGLGRQFRYAKKWASRRCRRALGPKPL